MSPHAPSRSPVRATRVVVAVLLGGALTAAGCSSSDDRADSAFTPTTTEVTSTDGATDGDRPAPQPVLLDTGADVYAPMDAHPVGDSLLVAQRAGRVVELQQDREGRYDVVGTVVDLTDRVGSTEAEKGLLGLTTDSSDEHLYLNHTRADDGATVILELPLEGEPGSLVAGDPRELLVIDQPFPNHNGGDLAWGPDDMLWTGTGDGGGADDPDGRAQRLTDPLGKILRLDPALAGSGEDLAPADNPYADGSDGAGGEANPLIWARGVRNPWRISFDQATGDLWIADVGQNEVEEVTVLRADEGLSPGANLGWDIFEGDAEFGAVGPRDGWPDDDATVIDPFFTYTHDDGCSISGGFVYRGSALPQIEGRYLLSDYCSSDIRTVGGDGTGESLGISGAAVVSINPDERGEPLVLDSEGIRRIAPG